MRVKFFTLGCKVNQYESQALGEEFIKDGWEVTDRKADLYVINTCTVTHRADAKSKGTILRVRKENPKAKIAVCGCLAQLNYDFIKELDIDYIIPQDRKYNLVDIILGRKIRKRSIWDLRITDFFNHRAFVKIQDGCDNFCSFCKIPYLRGMSKSRDKKKIIEEIKRLLPKHKEIVLCGINIGFYGRDLYPKESLASLVSDILKIDNLGRIRFSSLEPYLLDDQLLSFFTNQKVCPHMHLPFQSGDAKILRLMNKKESTEVYYDVVKKVRKINSQIAISCDIMVGFPYEEEANFKNTVKFLEEIKPMRMHIFSFSPREGTRFEGSKLKGQDKIKERHNTLSRIAANFSLEYKKKFLGKRLKMIAEEKKDAFICGYTENYIRVYLKENIALGDLVPVTIERVNNNRVIGKVYAP